MVIAEPSASLAGQLRACSRSCARSSATDGGSRCALTGRLSPALFAGITGAGFDLLTYRKGPVADLPAAAFTTSAAPMTAAGPRVRARRHHGHAGDREARARASTSRYGRSPPRACLRRGRPAGAHPDLPHDLPAGEVCWRMSSRWREENYFRYARTHFALDALDSYAAVPTTRTGWSQPGEENRRRPGTPGSSRHRRGRSQPGRQPARAAQPRPRPPRAPDQPAAQRAQRPRPGRLRRARSGRGGRRGHPRPGPARRPGPGHGPAGRRDQADHPRHPDGRLQRRDPPGPRPGRPLRPRRRRGIRAHPRGPGHLRRHLPR